MLWILINDSRVIKYLLKFSFADICVSTLLCDDIKRDTKSVQGGVEKGLCNSLVIVVR